VSEQKSNRKKKTIFITVWLLRVAFFQKIQDPQGLQQKNQFLTTSTLARYGKSE